MLTKLKEFSIASHCAKTPTSSGTSTPTRFRADMTNDEVRAHTIDVLRAAGFLMDSENANHCREVVPFHKPE
jgi:hypothetical protein